jgi:phosphoribosylformimino-5-aminoimidazole carboxamide ribotide isomerase
MKVIPAIDLKDGKCVRLYQGDFENRTDYSSDPISIARNYQAMGFDNLHIVDLDGAMLGEQQNRNIVAAIASESDSTIQLGGGIRDSDTVSKWLAAGVSRCVIGSLAVTRPEKVKSWIDEFGADSIVLALDVKISNDGSPMLVTHGWTRTTRTDLWQFVDDYLEHELQHVLCTDVCRDGAMTGPNAALYRTFVKRYPAIELQASGGVRHAGDLRMLDDLGASAAITGRALLDGKINIEELGTFLRVA